MDGPTPPPIQLTPGVPPTQEQIEAIQAHMRADAERLGLSMENYVENLRAMALAQQAEQARQAETEGNNHHHDHDHDHNHDHHDHDHSHQQQHRVEPGPPKPESLAMAKFLQSQDLKPRTCIFQEKRKDIFRVKRAMRAIQSPAYQKARSKNALLPEVKDRATAELAFKLLPLSLLALRVQKVAEEDEEEQHEGHTHAKKKKKRVKGLWTVEIVQQQDVTDDLYYMWLYDGPQWRQRAYAIGALAGVMTLVMFPLWPLKLRQGAWYLSMAFFGIIVLFFVMAIVRAILFLITMFSHPPGLWLFPNLFEDVGFFESFVPVWAWQEDKKAARKAKRLEKERKAAAKASKLNGGAANAETTGADVKGEQLGDVQQRSLHASVEEADDE